MPRFFYEAVNEDGGTITGFMVAESPDTAKSQLSQRGYVPLKVKEQGAATSPLSSLGLRDRLSKVKPPDLILFTKQFRTLLRAGVPVLRLLQVLENQTQNARLKAIAEKMASDIKKGDSLHGAFQDHPRVFSPLYCSMVRAGETSGALPEILERLTYIIDHEHKIRMDIRSALQYPATVVVALTIAFFILLTFVIPKFVSIFQKAGVKLPWPTMICMWLYEFLVNHWLVLVAGAATVMVALVYFLKTEGGRLTRDTLVLRLPLFGELFIKAAMSRFASIFAILQASGVPVLDSLSILTGTIGNSAIAREFARLREKLEEGRGIAGPMSSAKYFTPMVVNMVAIGEESGKLDEMLHEVSTHYDDEVEYAIGRISEAIGPVLMVGLAGVVGFFAMAIFLPMWDLAQVATKGA